MYYNNYYVLGTVLRTFIHIISLNLYYNLKRQVPLWPILGMRTAMSLNPKSLAQISRMGWVVLLSTIVILHILPFCSTQQTLLQFCFIHLFQYTLSSYIWKAKKTMPYSCIPSIQDNAGQTGTEQITILNDIWVTPHLSVLHWTQLLYKHYQSLSCLPCWGTSNSYIRKAWWGARNRYKKIDIHW